METHVTYPFSSRVAAHPGLGQAEARPPGAAAASAGGGQKSEKQLFQCGGS